MAFRRPPEFARPVVRRWVYRLEVHRGQLPVWAAGYALFEFSFTPQLVWLRVRRVAKRMVAEITAAGGAASFQRHEAQMCPRCKRWAIGDRAKLLRKDLSWQKSRPGEPILPCDPQCKEVKARSEWLSEQISDAPTAVA